MRAILVDSRVHCHLCLEARVKHKSCQLACFLYFFMVHHKMVMVYTVLVSPSSSKEGPEAAYPLRNYNLG